MFYGTSSCFVLCGVWSSGVCGLFSSVSPRLDNYRKLRKLVNTVLNDLYGFYAGTISEDYFVATLSDRTRAKKEVFSRKYSMVSGCKDTGYYAGTTLPRTICMSIDSTQSRF